MKNFERLARFPRLVAEIIAAAPPDRLRLRPAAGGFALVEQPCHLADLEEDGFTVRITRLLVETNPFLPDFDGERIARERNYLQQDATAAAARFVALRTRNLERVAQLSPAEWNRSGEQEGAGVVTLHRVVERMGDHDASHAAELVALLTELNLTVPAELLEYEE
jgi:hypothetical protein